MKPHTSINRRRALIIFNSAMHNALHRMSKNGLTLAKETRFAHRNV